jgi:hypothetical protein
LNEPTEAWDLEQISIVAKYVSFIEPEKQRGLILAAFNRLSQLKSEEDVRIRDDFNPEFHFIDFHFFVFFATIASAVSDAQLVEVGFNAIPQAWPDDLRAKLLALFVEALPPHVRKQVSTSFLQRLPGPKNSLSVLRSQFAVAESLGVEELRALIKRYVEVIERPVSRMSPTIQSN